MALVVCLIKTDCPWNFPRTMPEMVNRVEFIKGIHGLPIKTWQMFIGYHWFNKQNALSLQIHVQIPAINYILNSKYEQVHLSNSG